MTITLESITIHFPADFDERAEWEAASKGYLGGVVVELEGGERYPAYFYDPVRLGQDLEADAGCGRPYAAEPGLIVVPEVTPAAIRAAVVGLARDGYFRHLRPIN
jgi:hypothetical protein